jgi:pilus assembly protein CpaE
LIVFRLDYPSIRNTRRLVAFIESGGYDRGKIRLVVNRYGQRYQIKPAQAQEALGMPIAAILPEDMSRVNYAVSIGMPIVEYRPRSPLSKRMIELAEAVTHHKT